MGRRDSFVVDESLFTISDNRTAVRDFIAGGRFFCPYTPFEAVRYSLLNERK